MVALSKSLAAGHFIWISIKNVDRSKKWSLIENRSVSATNQDFWMLNYYLQGNEGVFRALIEQNQIGQIDRISWPERLFQFLRTAKTLPVLCDFLKVIR